MPDPRTPPHPVTVIVPVYGDLPSLTACVESLREQVDQTVHRVLLVNDCGPDADEIETALLKLIAEEPSFFYERNPRNLGFVGNCNRAALELDTTDNDILLLNSDTVTTPGFIEELSAVLHSVPMHGAVCPRSNNATIASLPFKLRDPSVGREPARTAEVHAALRDSLPRFSVAPVAMGFCILIRRELIREYGLFDEVFAPGYGEENDFCLRIARHGYLSLIAHHALVFHMGGRSFVGARREALRSAHEKILTRRYPDYATDVRAYINEKRDPVDVFADALAPSDTVMRVLIDIDPSGGNLGGWELALLAEASRIAAAEDIRLTVSVPDRLSRRVARDFPTHRIVRQSQLDGQWDLAIARADNLRATQLARLNRVSLRWALTGHDDRPGADYADTVLAEFPTPILTLEDLVRRWGRSTVDVSNLRRRWQGITIEPDYRSGASAPLESRLIRLLRRATVVAPRTVGFAKEIAKRALRRD